MAAEAPADPSVAREEAALTAVWMSTTLCLTTCLLTSLAVACAMFALPVYERAWQGRTIPAVVAAVLGAGRGLRAHPALAWSGVVAVGLAAVALQAMRRDRARNVRLFLATSTAAGLATLAFLAVGLFAL